VAKSQATKNIEAQLQKKKGPKSNKNKKYGRNLKRCQAYRMRAGKPNGRGMPGNKAGKNHVLVRAVD